jgi:hypothetical protein
MASIAAKGAIPISSLPVGRARARAELPLPPSLMSSSMVSRLPAATAACSAALSAVWMRRCIATRIIIVESDPARLPRMVRGAPDPPTLITAKPPDCGGAKPVEPATGPDAMPTPGRVLRERVELWPEELLACEEDARGVSPSCDRPVGLPAWPGATMGEEVAVPDPAEEGW